MRRSSAALLLLATCMMAQRPTTGAVEGMVTNALTGAPIPKAHVTLKSDSGPRFGAISAADGKFSMAAVAPGRYAASVEHIGYLQAAGASGSTVESLEVKASDQSTKLDLKLAPQAVITGRVVNSNGDPVENAKVVASRGSATGTGETNRKGEFRISGLRAGHYTLRASPAEFNAPPEMRTDGTEEIYYGATDFASPVETHAGAESAGIEIRLVRSKIVRVSGFVSGMPPNAKDYVLEHDLGPDFNNGITTSMLTGSRFVIWRLTPGRYRLKVWCKVPGMTVDSAPVDIELGESNIDNIGLAFVPPFEVKGQVNGELPPVTGDGPKQAVILRSLGPRGGPLTPAEIGLDGTFLVGRAQPDRYRVLLAGMPSNVYVKEPAILDFTRGAPGAGIQVTLGVASARLLGTVQDGKGTVADAMVGLIRDEPYGGDLFRSAVTGADGKYFFEAVAPGKYKVFVFDRSDADWLKRGAGSTWYAKNAEKVEIADGDSITTDLKLPVWDNR